MQPQSYFFQPPFFCFLCAAGGSSGISLCQYRRRATLPPEILRAVSTFRSKKRQKRELKKNLEAVAEPSCSGQFPDNLSIYFLVITKNATFAQTI
jgi:hypothetical protein